MQKVTLKFPSLQLLGECLYLIGVTHPEINYEQYTITAMLTDNQKKIASECNGIIIIDDSYTLESELED